MPLLTQLLIYAKTKWGTVGKDLKKEVDAAQVVVEEATAAVSEDDTNEELRVALVGALETLGGAGQAKTALRTKHQHLEVAKLNPKK